MRAMRLSLARPAKGTAVIDLPVLRTIVAACVDDLLAKRDRALLLVTYFARLRRSETVALDRESVVRQPGALFLHVATCEHPLPLRFFPETALDPVRALESWISERALHARTPLAAETGPLFVSMRPGRSNTLRLGKRLYGHDLERILKRRVARAGLDADAYSSRALRAAPDPPPSRTRGSR
jgi:site-specific recombinase XerC